MSVPTGEAPREPMSLATWEALAQTGNLPEGALYRLGQAVAEDRLCLRRAAKAVKLDRISLDDQDRLRREAHVRARRYLVAGGDMDNLPAPERRAA